MAGIRPVRKPDLDIVRGLMKECVSTEKDPYQCLFKCFMAISEAMKADRAFILRYDEITGEFEAFMGHNIDIENLFFAEDISQSILKTVMRDVKPIITTNAMEDPRFSMKISVQVSGLRSVLCAPLTVSEGMWGLIYLDNRLTSGYYQKQDLEYLVECAALLSSIMAECYPHLAYRPGS